MSLLDAARRLAADMPRDEGHDQCYYCGGGSEYHAPDCPWLAMPKIVRVLEAAERLRTAGNDQPWGLETPLSLRPYDGDPACYWCGGAREDDHTSDCPWQALVAALKVAQSGDGAALLT